MSIDPTPTPVGPSTLDSQTDAPACEPVSTSDPAIDRPDVPAWILFLGLTVLGLAADLASKHWAFHYLKQACRPVVVIPRVLEFQTMLNKGALFGIGAGQTSLFLIASALALILVIWMFLGTPRRKRLLHIGLGAILAGALGNMYDRVFIRLDQTPVSVAGRGGIYVEYLGDANPGYRFEEYPRSTGGEVRWRETPPELVGCVRDFIKIPTKWWRTNHDVWPWVFNVADMLLVGGVGILAIHLWRDQTKRPKPVIGESPPSP
ncbi:MAG: signal peptidase II [Planctomycetes bacterium]|nr:signal peptidase II [Planctomycetota bacterium]